MHMLGESTDKFHSIPLNWHPHWRREPGIEKRLDALKALNLISVEQGKIWRTSRQIWRVLVENSQHSAELRELEFQQPGCRLKILI